MTNYTNYAEEQYELVKGSRKVLLDYCSTISAVDFTDGNTSFGRGGSMRNLLVHIANTYQYWIAYHVLKRDVTFPKFEEKQNISEVVALFAEVDGFMDEFLKEMDNRNEIEYELGGIKGTAKPFTLFTHVITHEYHHKGQVLSISRHLGYTPADTDVMR